MNTLLVGVSVAVLLCGVTASAGEFKLNLGGGASSATAVSSATCVSAEGKGLGATREEALKDAYRAAVEAAIGLYVDAEAESKNDEIIKDQVLTHSNAYVKSYDIVREKARGNGLYEVVIKAQVEKSPLVDRLREVLPGVTIKIDAAARGLHAQVVSQEKRSADALALLKNGLDSFDPLASLVKVGLAGEPQAVPDKTRPDVVNLRLPLSFTIDREKYLVFTKSLSKTLRQISADAKSVRLQQADSDSMGRYLRPNNDHSTYFDAKTYLSGVDMRRYFQEDTRRKDFKLPVMGAWDAPLLLAGEVEGQAMKFSRFGYVDMSRGGAAKAEFFLGSDDKLRLERKDEKVLVGVIDRVSKLSLGMGVYDLDSACVDYLVAWQNAWHSRSQALNTQYRTAAFAIALVDKNGNTIEEGEAKVLAIDLINSAFFTLSHVQPVRKILCFTPFTGCAGSVCYQWASVDVAKDDLPKIDTVKVDYAQ